jgi:hypothetical protein
MRPSLLTLCATLSCLLCLAALAGWVRSALRYDRLDYTWVDRSQLLHRTWIVTSYAGQCTFGCVVFTLNDPVADPNSGWYLHHALKRNTNPNMMWPPSRSSAFPIEFSLLSRPATPTRVFDQGAFFSDWQITFPHWAMVLLFSILPAFRCRIWLHQRRARRLGHCPRCGYDLRATPARCPECGAQSPPEPAAA